MATLLYRLGKASYRRGPLVIASWIAVIVAVGALAATVSRPMSASFSIPGIPSERATDLQQSLFPGAASASDEANVNVVVAAPRGHRLAEPRYSRAADKLVGELRRAPQMPAPAAAERAGRPLANPAVAGPATVRQITAQAVKNGTPPAQARRDAEALSPLSRDGRVGIINFAFDVKVPTDVKPATQERIEQIMAGARRDGLTVEANGQGMQNMQPGGGAAELLGVAVALIVLVLTFGSLVAAGLPILTAIAGIALGMLGVTAMTALFDIDSSTPMLATMIGLAVGIDYALFILARYRSELEQTDERADAVGLAVGTAGSAVVFAGLTVLIALAALSVVGIPFLTSMGLAAAATVLVAVLVALTLLPAILGLTKSKAFAGRVRSYAPARDEDHSIINNGVRWARTVGRAPIVVILATVVVLGAIALPARDLQLALPTDANAAQSSTLRKASDLVAGAFGPGREAPLVLVADGRALADRAARTKAYGEVVRWAASERGVANAQVVQLNKAGDGAQVMITPATGGSAPATEDLLHRLRDGQAGIDRRTGLTTGITGLTAIQTDVSERLDAALPVYLAVVIGLAFVLLMVVFRSVLVPLTATFGFLLTVLATFGATVAVFQHGRLGIVEGQPIVSFMPIFLIGIVFGLAMDYQVFLVTRIREAHVHGEGPVDSVHDGFRGSARVVTAAALIMISVFSAFMLEDEPVIRSMGFALAIAVAFDAFVVRMTLIPALMYLLGERAWWLPRWLDRILPRVDVEGEHLAAKRRPQRAVAATEGDGETEQPAAAGAHL